MPRRTEDDDERNLGAAALGALATGSVLGAALGAGGLLGERPPRPYDPAPIGSDPWLERELRAALNRAGLAASFEVKDAIVTVHDAETAPLAEAFRSVAGTKAIRWRT
jgi:hypothetical protein